MGNSKNILSYGRDGAHVLYGPIPRAIQRIRTAAYSKRSVHKPVYTILILCPGIYIALSSAALWGPRMGDGRAGDITKAVSVTLNRWLKSVFVVYLCAFRMFGVSPPNARREPRVISPYRPIFRFHFYPGLDARPNCFGDSRCGSQGRSRIGARRRPWMM